MPNLNNSVFLQPVASAAQMVSAVATAWSPGGAGSSSPRWSSPVNQSVKLQAGEKRSSSAVAYDDPPVSVKRRHRGKRHKSSVGPLPRPNGLPSPPMNRGGPPACPELNEPEGGYNSEDEYSHLGVNMSEEEWLEKDRRFERVVKKQGYIIKYMVEDGNCLFRSVADQVYGDQEMHACVRDHCMDYIVSLMFWGVWYKITPITRFSCFQSQNADYYSQYMTEDIDSYVERKRYSEVHGNHLEIQALSEMYNRPIHIYCYSLGKKPIVAWSLAK